MLGNQRLDSFSKLVFELSKLPGVGEKTATRLAYYILKQGPEYAQSLSQSILEAKQKIGLCEQCFNFSDQAICSICSDARRDHGLVCVVERPADVTAVEQSGSHRGVYHVLHGALSPLDGIGPEELKIRELLGRIEKAGPKIEELILATNPSIEGDATALYLGRLMQPFGVKLTRLAHGLPVGGLIEYADRQTIGRALQNRIEVAAR